MGPLCHRTRGGLLLYTYWISQVPVGILTSWTAWTGFSPRANTMSGYCPLIAFSLALPHHRCCSPLRKSSCYPSLLNSPTSYPCSSSYRPPINPPSIGASPTSSMTAAITFSLAKRDASSARVMLYSAFVRRMFRSSCCHTPPSSA